MEQKRTKIIATIGPASSSRRVIRALIKAGLNIARLNFSHGTYEEKKEQIKNLRKIAKELKTEVSIMADLQGPKLRLGEFDEIKSVKKGNKFFLSIEPAEKEIPTQFDLSPHVYKGERIFIADGLIEFIVLEVKGRVLKVQAQNDGVISSKKGINIPDSAINNAVFTEKDEADLIFALKAGVDMVALSLIQTVKDMKKAKDIISKSKSRIKIVAKIEKKMAVENLEEIMKASDMVMVARGDLGVETKAVHVPLIQQKILNLGKELKKPVIVATHMLESMILNPRPTRAEVSDIANAVFDRADALMLSGETALGKYPVEAVKIMHEIIVATEEHQNSKHFKRP